MSNVLKSRQLPMFEFIVMFSPRAYVVVHYLTGNIDEQRHQSDLATRIRNVVKGTRVR